MVRVLLIFPDFFKWKWYTHVHGLYQSSSNLGDQVVLFLWMNVEPGSKGLLYSRTHLITSISEMVEPGSILTSVPDSLIPCELIKFLKEKQDVPIFCQSLFLLFSSSITFSNCFYISKPFFFCCIEVNGIDDHFL